MYESTMIYLDEIISQIKDIDLPTKTLDGKSYLYEMYNNAIHRFPFEVYSDTDITKRLIKKGIWFYYDDIEHCFRSIIPKINIMYTMEEIASWIEPEDFLTTIEVSNIPVMYNMMLIKDQEFDKYILNDNRIMVNTYVRGQRNKINLYEYKTDSERVKAIKDALFKELLIDEFIELLHPTIQLILRNI